MDGDGLFGLFETGKGPEDTAYSLQYGILLVTQSPSHLVSPYPGRPVSQMVYYRHAKIQQCQWRHQWPDH